MTIINSLSRADSQASLPFTTHRATTAPANEPAVFQLRSGYNELNPEFSITSVYGADLLSQQEEKDREKIKAEKQQQNAEYYAALAETKILNDKAMAKLQQTVHQAALLCENMDPAISQKKKVDTSNALMQNCLLALDNATSLSLVAQYVSTLIRVNHQTEMETVTPAVQPKTADPSNPIEESI